MSHGDWLIEIIAAGILAVNVAAYVLLFAYLAWC